MANSFNFVEFKFLFISFDLQGCHYEFYDATGIFEYFMTVIISQQVERLESCKLILEFYNDKWFCGCDNRLINRNFEGKNRAKQTFVFCNKELNWDLNCYWSLRICVYFEETCLKFVSYFVF